MILSVPPVIDVVTGTDWAAIWAAIATAVAAVVGVAGTSWQAARARKAASADVTQSLAASSADLRQNLEATAANLVTSINAEDRRAELAAKRRIYAASLASLKAMIPAVIMHRGEYMRAASQEERLAARSRMHEQRSQMLDSISEVQLIAPREIRLLADEAERFFMAYIDDTNNGAQLGPLPPPTLTVIDQLAKLMRQDLGVIDDRSA